MPVQPFLLRNQHYFRIMFFVYFLKSSDSLFQPNDFALEVRSQHKLCCAQTPRHLLFILARLSPKGERVSSLKRGRQSMQLGVGQAGEPLTASHSWPTRKTPAVS